MMRQVECEVAVIGAGTAGLHAWKAANAIGGSPQGSWKGKAVENGSKVFLTGLPVDVAEKDVEVRACL